MLTRAQKLKSLVFLFVSLLLGLALLFALLGFGRLTKPQKRFKMRLTDSIPGLEEGTPVLLNGVQKGEVADVHLEPTSGDIEIVLEVAEDTPVLEGAKGRISVVNLLGPSYCVDLRGGKRGATEIPPGSEIEVELSPTLTNLIEAGSGAVEKGSKLIEEATEVITENRPAIRNILTNLDLAVAELRPALAEAATKLISILDDTRTVMDENRESLRETLANARDATEALRIAFSEDRLTVLLKEVQGTVGTTRDEISATAESLRTTLKEADVAGRLERAVSAFEALAADASSAIRILETYIVKENRAVLRDALVSLTRASRAIEQLMDTLARSPNALLFGTDAPERREKR
jgi:ABC-type transporter Mla subunit MlaD